MAGSSAGGGEQGGQWGTNGGKECPPSTLTATPVSLASPRQGFPGRLSNARTRNKDGALLRLWAAVACDSQLGMWAKSLNLSSEGEGH